MPTSIFNVDAFKASMAGGGVRPNQFVVTLTFPTFVQDQGNATQNAQFLVTAASLPGSNIGVASTMYRGRQVNFAGDRQFAPWSITVINDNTMSIRNAFEDWMNGMDNLQSKAGRIEPLNYQTVMYVDQLDRNNTVVKSYVINNAFPVNVSDIALDFGANDQMSQFSVELVFQDFETNFIPQTAGETFAG